METPEERAACAELGAELYQGFFFQRPTLVPGAPVPTGPLASLRSAVELHNQVGFEEIERVIVSDPGLSVRLLRYVNAAAIGSRRRLSSVRDALVLLGARTVRQWALLVLLSDVGHRRPAVIAGGLLRGRLCELFGREVGASDPEAWFAMGVLSVADALMDAPMEAILPTLPLAAPIEQALLHRKGPMGHGLELALRLERGEAVRAEPELTHLGNAVLWTERTLVGLRA